MGFLILVRWYIFTESAPVAHFNVKTIFPGMENSHLEDHATALLIFKMIISKLERWHRYIEINIQQLLGFNIFFVTSFDK